MSKSTPLNQLPSFADADPPHQPAAQAPQQAQPYRFNADDDATVQEVMGDLASSIPGFAPPPAAPQQQQLPQQQQQQQVYVSPPLKGGSLMMMAAQPPAAAPTAMAATTTTSGALATPLSSGFIATFVPAHLQETAWLGLIAGVLFILISLAPIERVLSGNPWFAKGAGPYGALALRALIMAVSVVAAWQLI